MRPWTGFEHLPGWAPRIGLDAGLREVAAARIPHLEDIALGMTGGQDAEAAGREGFVLAARWSIERLHRPATPDLLWLGYAKPEVARFACLACGDDGFKQGVVRSGERTLYLCPACASHQMHPPDLPAVPLSDFGRRWLLEAGLDLPGAAQIAARVTAGRTGGRLLDLGCGLGVVVDMVRHLPGWSAAGIDPGPLAALGREVFGAELHPADAEGLAVALRAGAPDVVLCTGGLERCSDPLGLLQQVAAVAGDARWSIVAADAALLYAGGDAEAIRRLLERLLLLSHVGLRQLLARAGLPAISVRKAEGTLLAELPAQQAVPVVPEAVASVLDRYLAARLAMAPQDPSLVIGLQAAALPRAIERAVGGDAAAWVLARKLLARLGPALAAAGEAARDTQATSLEALLARAPAGAAQLLGEAGLFHLHGSGPSMQALMCFELAALLSGRVLSLQAAPLPDEAERYWSARFQAALISRAMGDHGRAMAALSAIVEEEERSATPAPAWAARAQAEITAMQVQPAAAPEHRPIPKPGPRRRRVRAG